MLISIKNVPVFLEHGDDQDLWDPETAFAKTAVMKQDTGQNRRRRWLMMNQSRIHQECRAGAPAVLAKNGRASQLVLGCKTGSASLIQNRFPHTPDIPNSPRLRLCVLHANLQHDTCQTIFVAQDC